MNIKKSLSSFENLQMQQSVLEPRKADVLRRPRRLKVYTLNINYKKIIFRLFLLQ